MPLSLVLMYYMLVVKEFKLMMSTHPHIVFYLKHESTKVLHHLSLFIAISFFVETETSHWPDIVKVLINIWYCCFYPFYYIIRKVVIHVIHMVFGASWKAKVIRKRNLTLYNDTSKYFVTFDIIPLYLKTLLFNRIEYIMPWNSHLRGRISIKILGSYNSMPVKHYIIIIMTSCNKYFFSHA